MKQTVRVFLLVLILPMYLGAQEKSAGKFSGYMFGDYFYNVARDTGISSFSNVATPGKKDMQGFQFRRIYFTYDYEISDIFSTRFRLEADQVSNTSDGKIGVFVKDAYLRWRNIFSGSDLFFGIQPPPAYEISEAVWGYRSLDKTIMDLRGIVSSRDIGVALKGKFNEAGTVNYWLMAGNNSGNKPESDKYKRIYAHLYFKPVQNFHVTVYGDLRLQASISDPNSTGTPQGTLGNDILTSALFVGYSEKDVFSIGAEGFVASTANGIKKGTIAPFELKPKNAIGFSVFGSYNLHPDVAAVVRFDFFDPNSNRDFTGDARNYILAGISWKPDKSVSIIPNVQIESYEKQPATATTSEIKHKASVTARVTLFYTFL
ncbi:MAG: hypothetical protein KF749_12500 [Bacteroidetes bacterium]|nr:hypothetical protein [Bacteroidota bacterium]MCW5897089.1 hypothetical protein [Bacteroidota bacterium]